MFDFPKTSRAKMIFMRNFEGVFRMFHGRIFFHVQEPKFLYGKLFPFHAQKKHSFQAEIILLLLLNKLERKRAIIVDFETLLMLILYQKTAVFSSWSISKKKQQNCSWFHKNDQKINFLSGNPIKPGDVTNFKIRNFETELYEINFECWNVPKYWKFWLPDHSRENRFIPVQM